MYKQIYQLKCIQKYIFIYLFIYLYNKKKNDDPTANKGHILGKI